MAELLVASGSKRISALTSVSGISGSTAMPIVMGGNTVQVSHTNFLGTTLLNQSNTFSGNNTFGGQTTLLNGVVNGNLVVKGDLTANQYIISSSVSHITSSFSSGSTIFGDSLDDTHQFTGSVSINGNLSVPSFTGSLSFTNLTDLPTLVSASSQITYGNISSIPNGIVSGSSQVSFNGIVDKPTLVSGSSQISYPQLSNIPNGIISSSAQIDALFNIDGLVSGSSQISFNGITDKPTLVSSSQQIRDYGIFATTGSNTFRGNQIVTGSVGVSGSVNADSFTLDVTSTTNIPALNSAFNSDLSGSESVIINKSLLLGDGKVLVAGKFQSIDAHSTNGIARFNSNGTIDTSFTSPTFGATFIVPQVYTFVTQSDDKIIVGGDFSTVNGVNRRGIARLNSNGTLDTSFASQSFASFGEIRDIAVQSDGKVVFVGSFTSGSRRVNSDGTVDSSLVTSTSSGFGANSFYSVALLPSGSEEAILIGGDFQQWNTFSDYKYIVKLHNSGALDFGFAGINLDIATIAGDRIEKIKVGNDGYIYVAGSFRDTASSLHAGFARLTTVDEGDGIGAFDSSFRTYITSSFVNDFDFYAGDKILLGGNFTTFGNPAFSTTSANRFVIINYSNGNRISNWFTDGLASTYNLNTGSVNSVTLLPNDNVLVGGTFTSASFPLTAREGLASLKLAGLGSVTTTNNYSITTNTNQLLISSSNTYFSGVVNISGSVTATSFIGDGSGLTGVTAGGVDFDDITNKPTLVSGSSQISYPQLSNIPNGIISSSAQIDLLFDIDGLVSSSQQVLNYNIFTTTSSFNSFTSSYNTGSFTGSFFGDGSGLFTGSFSGDGSGLTGVIETGSFATTGSNVFRGNQIVTGSVTISGSISQDGLGVQNIVISNAPITTLTTATGLTAIGYGAGQDITTGYDNTFIGNQAGRDNDTGYVNTFVGAYAGALNTSGIFNTFIGRAAGQFNTTGQRNTFVGTTAGQVSTGNYNTFLGSGAGISNTTAENNTFVGAASGEFTLTGNGNTFVGKSAGAANVVGAGNTFIGHIAGFLNTGNSNTFIGEAAGFRNSTADENTFIGSYAGYNNTIGADNTFIGYSAGGNNSVGTNNTFIGWQAGAGNVSGSGNTFVGRDAGLNSTNANNNAFIGYFAGYSNKVGTNNTFVGPFAGQQNISGSSNTFIGDSAGASNTQADSNTFVGQNAGFNNSVGTDNTFVGRNAGTNTTSGSGNSFFGRQAAAQNNTGANNSTFGFQAGQFNQSGSNNTFFGKDAGTYLGNGSSQNNSADNSVFLGAGSRASGSAQTNQIVIGYQAVGNGSNTVTLGNDNITDTYLKGTVHMENGYSILTQVSQSLEFANDAAAAAGGVPLGGLYRSGNFILIRLV